jgi:hypothetical protein
VEDVNRPHLGFGRVLEENQTVHEGIVYRTR